MKILDGQVLPDSIEAVAGAEPALVSETFARRFGVLDGGRVEITTAAGPRAHPTATKTTTEADISCAVGENCSAAMCAPIYDAASR